MINSTTRFKKRLIRKITQILTHETVWQLFVNSLACHFFYRVSKLFQKFVVYSGFIKNVFEGCFQIRVSATFHTQPSGCSHISRDITNAVCLFPPKKKEGNLHKTCLYSFLLFVMLQTNTRKLLWIYGNYFPRQRLEYWINEKVFVPKVCNFLSHNWKRTFYCLLKEKLKNSGKELNP